MLIKFEVRCGRNHARTPFFRPH